jgi:hypothetical protein
MLNVFPDDVLASSSVSYRLADRLNNAKAIYVQQAITLWRQGGKEQGTGHRKHC